MPDLPAPTAAPGYGTSMHWPYCRDRSCTGCLPPLDASVFASVIDRKLPMCDASVPSFFDDERRFECGHQATVEALWTDGSWHPRCDRHVNGYPANRVRSLTHE